MLSDADARACAKRDVHVTGSFDVVQEPEGKKVSRSVPEMSAAMNSPRKYDDISLDKQSKYVRCKPKKYTVQWLSFFLVI